MEGNRGRANGGMGWNAMPAIADAVLDCETAEEFAARIADA